MKGIALILTLIVVAVALAIVLGSSEIFISELVASQNIHLSTVAFYVADSAIEAALFADRVGGGLADGFTCNSAMRNSDTCLDKLDNGGTYTYTVSSVSPNRKIVARGTFLDMNRSIEVKY